MTRNRAARALLLLLILPAALLAADAERPRAYTVVLSDPSVADLLPRAQRSAPAKRAARPPIKGLQADVAAKQQSIRARLADEGVEIAGSVHNVLNAIFVFATREQAARLREVGGVDRVVRARRFRRLTNAAEQIIRAPEARAALGGDSGAGAGIRIAVLDSGLDLTHSALQDPTLSPPAGFPKARPEDRRFTSGKVIAARSYVPLLNPAETARSRPDDETPRDRVGHGTAIAMIAAGRPVDSPVGRLVGVAPKAFLGNYKIFGSPDINEFSNDFAIIAAIDDATVDGMDVLVLSFGSVAQFPWDEQGFACSDDEQAQCDPAAQAAQNAIEAFGVAIAAAAGNAGAFGEQAFPTQNTIFSPATAPGAIAVAATVNSRQLGETVRFGGRSVDALAAVGPRPPAPLTAPAVDAFAVGDAFACEAFPAGSFAGAIAVIERGNCQPEFKIDFADQAGAVGAVIINSEDRDFPEVLVGLETTDIPTFTIGSADGNDLIAQLSAGAVTITLDPTLVSRPFALDQVAPFSSRGPSVLGAVKPEIAAPGTFVYAAAQRFDSNGDAFSLTGFASVDGTSFAAPMVAGAAALVWQANPNLTSAQVKSAVINTARTDAIFEDGELASITAVGAGLLDVQAAVSTPVVAEPATLSFGALNGVTLPLELTLFVDNISNRERSLTAEVAVRDAPTTALVEVNSAQSAAFTLGPGETAELQVRLAGTTPPPGQYEGFVRIAGDVDGRGLSIPYYFAVGDGVAFNSLAIAGTGVVGTVGEPHPELLILKVIDRHGQPVAEASSAFSVTDGGGSIIQADASTDAFGVAAADVDMGPNPGFQDFEAQVAGLRVPFFNEARNKPLISGIVNGAGFAADQPVAPGSIISVFGDALAEFVGSATTLPLPLALKHVSFSFDFAETGLSVPAHFFFSSGGQLNIQVPWEFLGFNFADVKVRIEDSASEVFRLNLADAAPGLFDFDFLGERIAVATHADGSVITPDNPARPGETIVVYGTGFGPVDEPQVSGEAASTDRLARTMSLPLARIAGRGASVLFSGLTPSFVGLYQANVTVPADAPSGRQTLQLEAAGFASNTVQLWVQ